MSEATIPGPDAGSLPPWANGKATEEEKVWGDEDRLKGVKLDNDILWHQWYGRIVICAMVVFVLVYLGALIAWVAHYTTPWTWLSPDQLSKIQSVIFSGSIGAVVSSYMQKQLQK